MLRTACTRNFKLYEVLVLLPQESFTNVFPVSSPGIGNCRHTFCQFIPGNDGSQPDPPIFFVERLLKWSREFGQCQLFLATVSNHRCTLFEEVCLFFVHYYTTKSALFPVFSACFIYEVWESYQAYSATICCVPYLKPLCEIRIRYLGKLHS